MMHYYNIYQELTVALIQEETEVPLRHPIIYMLRCCRKCIQEQGGSTHCLALL